MHRQFNTRCSMSILAAGILMAPLGAGAATYTWTANGAGTWSTEGNWDGGTTPVEGDDTVVQFFSGTSGAENTVSGNFTSTNDVETVDPTGSFNLESLILNGVASGNDRIVTIGGTQSFRFTGDANSISFAPGGKELIYSIHNSISFTNGLTISSSSNSAVGQYSNMPNEITGAISGTGGLVKEGSGRVSLDGKLSFSGGFTMNEGRVDIGYTGTNTLSGGVIINSGTVVLGHDNALGTSQLTLNSGLLSNSGLFGSGDNDSRDLTNNVVFGGNFQIISSSIQQGNYSFAGTVDLGNDTRTITTDSTTTGAATTGNTVTFSNTISNGGIIKSGRGGLLLSNANSSYSGPTVVRMGTLTVANDAPSGANGALGNATSAIELGDDSTSAGNTIRLLVSGAFTVGRNINVNSNNSSGDTTLGGTGDNDSAYSGLITLNKSVLLTSGAQGANAVTYSGNITGDFGVGIVGGGNTRFTNAKSYTGGTTVSDGTLQVDGSLSNSNITIGGTEAATLNGSGGLNFNVNGDLSDLITVLNLGTLDISGLTLAVNLTGVQTQDSYVIADYSTAGATLAGSTFANVTGLGGAWEVDYGVSTPNAITLVSVPEPASAAVLALGGLFMVRRRRRSVTGMN